MTKNSTALLLSFFFALVGHAGSTESPSHWESISNLTLRDLIVGDSFLFTGDIGALGWMNFNYRYGWYTDDNGKLDNFIACAFYAHEIPRGIVSDIYSIPVETRLIISDIDYYADHGDDVVSMEQVGNSYFAFYFDEAHFFTKGITEPEIKEIALNFIEFPDYTMAGEYLPTLGDHEKNVFKGKVRFERRVPSPESN